MTEISKCQHCGEDATKMHICEKKKAIIENSHTMKIYGICAQCGQGLTAGHKCPDNTEALEQGCTVDKNPIMVFFEYEHLPEELQEVSARLCMCAHKLNDTLPDGPEKSAGLRKLLEAKDCFVRASFAK